jgi:hypothetical protein
MNIQVPLNVGNSRPARQLLASKEIMFPCASPPPPRARDGTAPSGPGPPHYRGFTLTLRHTTVGRTPLDEWSARRTAHDVRKRLTSILSAGFEPAIPASERPQTHALDRSATGIDISGNAEILYRTSFRSGSLSIYVFWEASCFEMTWHPQGRSSPYNLNANYRDRSCVGSLPHARADVAMRLIIAVWHQSCTSNIYFFKA